MLLPGAKCRRVNYHAPCPEGWGHRGLECEAPLNYKARAETKSQLVSAMLLECLAGPLRSTLVFCARFYFREAESRGNMPGHLSECHRIRAYSESLACRFVFPALTQPRANPIGICLVLKAGALMTVSFPHTQLRAQDIRQWTFRLEILTKPSLRVTIFCSGMQESMWFFFDFLSRRCCSCRWRL